MTSETPASVFTRFLCHASASPNSNSDVERQDGTSDLVDDELLMENVAQSPSQSAVLSSSSQRKNRRRLLWLLPLVVGVLGAGAIAQSRSTSQTPVAVEQSQALPVETMMAEPVTSYTVQRTYTGEITARRTSDLGFELAGTVTQLYVEEGEPVAAGQVLAELDMRSLDTERQQLVAQRDQMLAQLQELQAGPRTEEIAAARAAVADLEQQVQLAQLQESRREYLHAEGAISREELDQQSFSRGSLENRLRQAQSQLDELLAGTRSEQLTAQSARVRQLDASIQAIDVQRSKSTLTAPFNGVVSQRLIDEGVVASPGQPVLKLVEGDYLEARIGVPTDEASAIAFGSSQTLQVNGQAIPATVTALLPELDPTSRTVTVVLQLEPSNAVTIGQTAQLLLNISQPAAGFWVPSTALIQGGRGLWSVYVLDDLAENENPVVAMRTVEVLHTDTNRDRVLVRGTLQDNDQIITSGTHRIVPGQAVQALP
ncbi:MAG: efflux RND transporter periplasmic adaptor subunit [Thainema sp.]